MRYELSWSKTSVEISLCKCCMQSQNKDAKEIMWYCMENKETIQHLTMSHLVRVQLNSSVVAGDGGVKVFGFERDVSGIFRLVGRRLVHHTPSSYIAPLRSSFSFLILALSHFFHCHMLFLVVDHILESTTECNWPGRTRWFSRHGVISRVRQFVKQHFQAKSAKSRQICKFIHGPLVRRWQLALFAKTFSVDQGQFPLTDVGLQAKRRFGFGAKK